MLTLQETHEHMANVRRQIQRVIVGQHEVIDSVLIGLFAGGHVLLQSVPGLGKTLLVKTLSEVLGLEFRRIQFTPDLTPTDILGDGEIRGPIFTQLLLADEINRAQPKTQSALLEAMQEHRVTKAGVTHTLEPPFLVMATQNPIEQEGTFPLPEAQLDRFMLQVIVPSPTRDELHTIATLTTQGEGVTLPTLLDVSQVLAMQEIIHRMPVPEEIVDLAVELVLSTRPQSAEATKDIRHAVRLGASPRGVQSLLLAGKAHAVLEGHTSIDYDDVIAVAVIALQHRIILSFHGMAMGAMASELIEGIVEGLSYGHTTQS